MNNIDKFSSWVRQSYSDGTVNPVMVILSAAINLSIELDKYKGRNPIPKLLQSLPSKQKKQVKSFSLSEVKVIIQAFRDGRFDSDKSAYLSSYYADLIEFRFLTGCRPSEAFALTWSDIKDDGVKCHIVFNKRWSSGQLLDGTKNGVQSRKFPCNKQLTDLLRRIPKRHETLVFPSPLGEYIDLRNFVNRAWRPLINRLVELGEVKEYLPYYDQRHTFGTHVVRSGHDLKTISTIMGNSPETLMKHYIAANEDIELPEM